MANQHLRLFSRNVALDTSFIVSNGFNFRSQEMLTLARLGAAGDLNILIVDITLREVEKKITEAICTATKKLRQPDLSVLRALPLFRRFGDVYGEERIIQYIDHSFKRFIKSAHVKIINSDTVQPSRVFNRYFRQWPPFSNKNNKKAEFPDAFALEALNLWCQEQGERSYLISNDSDWHTFGEHTNEWFDQKPRLFALNNATELIELVIRNDSALANLTRFADTLLARERVDIDNQILSAVRRCSFVQDGNETALSSMSFGVVEAHMKSSNLIDTNINRTVFHVVCEIVLMIGEAEDNRSGWGFPRMPISRIGRLTRNIPATLTISHKGGIAGDVSLDLAVPATVEVDSEESESLDAAEWIENRPVIICGAEEGVITDSGMECQRFSSLLDAKMVFPDLDVWHGGERFTAARGNVLCDELRFESWKAADLYSR